MITFKDVLNPDYSLRVGTIAGAVALTTYQKDRPIGIFLLNPLDFGELAAAIWECSPSKPPVTISSTR